MYLQLCLTSLLWTQLLFLVFCSSNVEQRCKTCKDIVENFKKGLDNTKKQNFGGGNTDWEESRLGSYANSETRLLEIFEKLCESVSKESICHAMVEEHEEDFEHWWFKEKNNTDLHTFLCIEKVKVCCPENTFGPTCKECPGGTKSPCNGHGSCEGGGTRGGKGTCSCDDGYRGDLCDECKDNFFETENKLCEACHEACKDTCTGPGPKGCDDCKDGWRKNENEVCADINECEEQNPCSDGEYCENTEGSYKCTSCHASCDGNCTGLGREHCLACKSGYTMEEGKGCQDVDECQDESVCSPGTYCSNNDGSYSCEGCHEACEDECTGPGSTNCKACKEGYQMEENDCKDIDECVTQNIVCPAGQHCKNTIGSHECTACHKACESCVSAGAEGCTKCNKGYEMDQGKCKDINECKKNKPCDKATEKCFNSPGSYRCGCKNGYERKDGACVKETSDEEADDDEDDEQHDEL